jgi:glycosyltransferase involved in cell wall biosynthesis
MTSERVSVILPVYNGALYLAGAMRSVLTQSTRPDEIIVVDDGSTDDSAAVVSSLSAASLVPIHYIHQANQGPAAARNAGLAAAGGDYIAFQDADDRWLPDKLAVQVSLLQCHVNAQAVIGYTQLIFEPDSHHASANFVGRPGLIMLLQASLFRRTLFDQVGGFDPALHGDEDIEWFLRALEQSIEIVVHPEIVVTYRRHAANLTGSLQRSQLQLVTALRRALARRRQAQNSTGRVASLHFVPATDR